jgi:hypothetical protein
MFEKLLTLLLHGKGALTAGVLVVSTTGVVVSGTVNGQSVNLTLTPVAQQSSDDESGCSAAAHIRNEALKSLHETWQTRRAELKTMAETAKASAKAAGKEVAEKDLENAVESLKKQLDEIRSAHARLMQERAASELGKCDDNDEEGGVTFDLATLNTLREDLAKVVAEADRKMGDALAAAKSTFDQLVANAKAKVDAESSDSADSEDSGDSEDSKDSKDSRD